MELSERPPIPVQNQVHPPPQMMIGGQNADSTQQAYQVSNASDYPHIVIGGKPFFLVPSSHSPSSVLETTVNNSEAYAYPQHMPIYEEIDYTTVSAPMSSGSATMMMMMDRPLSSAASHSNSAHTNTSELSSGGDSSSSNSSQNKNPAIILQDSTSADNQQVSQQFMTPRHSQQNRVRLADGVVRSASPQSPFSARLSGKNQNKSTNSSSVYYYSETLKKPSLVHNDEQYEKTVEISNSSSPKVNTKVTLMEEKDAGSTLV